ncbi:single-stranded DNA-binding protein [Rhodococcus spelaei]|uniref:Single-stranded DNA-binding protein n=1 Tax=Rhodococcus spelaei TaxID=2546320 RepID=A0A541BM12_9NOCA|nr:single-stranded DNA-binding protein [Rhodococcus spelaei]TQF73366.1 single-stranded DNA-binding protein [Rhodococcus spelaei]
MYETHTAVVGTVITIPAKRLTNSGEEVISFRMASNTRRRDQSTGEWTDGGTLYLTVSCWRRLVAGVGATLMKGDPIIAYGQLRTNEYTTREGVDRSDLEMRASALGPDLARCIAKLDRSARAGQSGQEPGTGQGEDPDATSPDPDAEPAPDAATESVFEAVSVG